jgi:hypothetical protein
VNQKGQTLILMLIVTVVSLTIGVAISSRAVSTLRQTSYTAQAGQAQKFADAGIEHALPNPGSLLGCTSSAPCKLDVDNDGDDKDVSYYVEQSGGGSQPITFISAQDETYQLNLTDANLNGLEIEWSTNAIIVYSVITKTSAGTSIEQKGATDPDESDGCDLPSGSSDPARVLTGDTDYPYRLTVSGLSLIDPLAGDERYIRIRPMYCSDINTNIKVASLPSGTILPTQGYTITSTGTYGEAEWTAEVTKMNPALPAIFDYAIFSDTRLTK